MQARPYQLAAKSLIRQKFLEGHRKVLLWMAGGGGKTFIFCDMIKEAVARGKTAIVIVRGRKLVDQASQRLFHEKVSHGVLMANHWNYHPNERVQVCSIDTLLARNIVPEADIVIIDEAHLFSPNSKATVYLRHFKGFHVAVTATPYNKDGMEHLASTYVHPVTPEDLIKDGYLVDFKYYAPFEPDVTNVKISKLTGDYVESQLEEASKTLIGKVVEHWKEKGENRPTIGFAVSVRHSKSLTETFKASGITAEHLDAQTPEKERQAILDRSRTGETKVVFSVGVLSIGVDMPWISCIIGARKTKSLNLYIQQAVRGSRPFFHPDMPIETPEQRLEAIRMSVKPNCIYLDHAGNIKEHNLPTFEPEINMKTVKPKFRSTTKMCKECFCVFEGKHCPECGPKPQDELGLSIEVIGETEEKLEELSGRELDPIYREFRRLLKKAKERGFRPLWANHKLVEMFGLERAAPYLSEAFVTRYKNSGKNQFSGSRFIGVQKL